MPHWTSSNAFLSVHLQFVYQWGTLFNHVVDVIVKEWDSILYITIFIIIDDINNYIHKEKKKWKNRLWEVMPSIPILTYVFSHETHRDAISLASPLQHPKYTRTRWKKKLREMAKDCVRKKKRLPRSLTHWQEHREIPFFPSQTPRYTSNVIPIV